MNPETAAPLKASVLEIQRMSTEDGPGIRTTVFFKGCPLKCAWCHNPESIALRPEVQWIESRCIGCRTCVDACPTGALTARTDGISINRMICRGCGTCADACPSTALERLGRPWTVADLVREVAKDKVYYEKSGGGLTASGGEATMQADFVAAFFRACRREGIPAALDTCGYCSRAALEKILPHTDLILFDLKLIDPEQHQVFTGRTNHRILENLCRVRDWMRIHRRPETLWIRTPIIPGATDSEENIQGLGRWLAQNLPDAPGRWELCAFNNLCRDKYTRLGLNWAYHHSDLISEEVMTGLAGVARTSGVNPDIVHWSGVTRQTQDPGLQGAKDAVRPPAAGGPRLSS